MRPVQVLDEQATLLLALEQPPKYLHYAAGYFASVLRSRDGNKRIEGEYMDAGMQLATEWSRRTASALRSGYAYWVKDEMLSVVEWAARLLPEDAVISRDMIPTDTGFLVLDGGREAPDVWGRTSYTHAISWQAGASWDDRTPGLWITLYSDLHDTRDTVTGMIMREMEAYKPGSTAKSLLGTRYQISHVEFLPWGDTVGPAELKVAEGYGEIDPEENESYYAHLRATGAIGDGEDGQLKALPTVENIACWVVALFEIMNQTVADVRDEPLERHARKRAVRMGIPDRVTVVTLRRTQDNARYEGESLVEWQHRWVVRGHWRNQPYGPGRQQTHRIWINPYVKGPQDRPLVITDKVYSLSR